MRYLRASIRILQVLAVFAILRYTGLLAGISESANSLIFKTGFRDVGISEPLVAEKFDYSFTIKNLDGEVMPMRDLENKVIFLNLWATWCGPCRIEMPAIQSLYDKINKDSIQFVMLSVDNPGQERKVRNFVEAQKYTFPVFTPVGYLTRQLQVPSIPTTLVIDKEGKVVMKRVGTTNFDTDRFREYLEKLASN